MQQRSITLRNGNTGTIVYESPFGKLLIVEHNGDELPPTHWHNNNGSFYADSQSPQTNKQTNKGSSYV